MAHATGEWLTFVDADDRLNADHLQLLMDAVADDWPDIVIGGYEEHRRQDGADVKAMRVVKAGDGREALSEMMLNQPDIIPGSPCNKLIRMRFVRNSCLLFDEQLTYSEDGVFMYNLLLLTDKIRTIPLCGYRYYMGLAHNTTSRYHACMEKVTREKERLRGLLMLKAGVSKEEVERRITDEQYITSYGLVCVLFRSGCPLTFGEKTAAVKRIVFDNPLMKESMRRKVCHTHNTFLRIYDALYATGSPWIMTAVFHIEYAAKRRFASLYNKISASLRRH